MSKKQEPLTKYRQILTRIKEIAKIPSDQEYTQEQMRLKKERVARFKPLAFSSVMSRMNKKTDELLKEKEKVIDVKPKEAIVKQNDKQMKQDLNVKHETDSSSKPQIVNNMNETLIRNNLKVQQIGKKVNEKTDLLKNLRQASTMKNSNKQQINANPEVSKQQKQNLPLKTAENSCINKLEPKQKHDEQKFKQKIEESEQKMSIKASNQPKQTDQSTNKLHSFVNPFKSHRSLQLSNNMFNSQVEYPKNYNPFSCTLNKTFSTQNNYQQRTRKRIGQNSLLNRYSKNEQKSKQWFSQQ